MNNTVHEICSYRKKPIEMLFGKKENPNLNADILEELFLRLPLKSLGRFKSVSKEWKSILESKWFVDRHLILAKSCQKILLAYDCECGVSPSLLPGLRDFEWSQEFVYLHCDATRPSMSYEGLVCFPEAEWVNVLNPSTGQLRRFHCPSLSNPRPKYSTFREESWTTYFPGYCAMGFGRDNVKGSYKVVRIFFDPTYCDILNVNTGEWRKLWKPRRCKVDVGRKSACVNGSIYWLRIRRGHVYTIVALDLHTEEFHDVPRPHLPKGIMFEAQIVNIRDRLAIAMPVSHPLHQYELEIWSMDGQKETWSKTHSISLASLGIVESRSFTPVTLSKQGDVLFYDDEGLLFKYISEKDKLQRLPEDICVISPYVENLVPLPAIQVELRTGITCLHPETETTDGMFRDLGTWLWKKKILMLLCFLCGLLLLHFWLTLEPIQKKAVFSVPFVIIRMFLILFFS